MREFAQWIFVAVAALSGVVAGALIGVILSFLSAGLENRPPTEWVALFAGGFGAMLSVILAGRLAPTTPRSTAVLTAAILLTASTTLRLVEHPWGSWVIVFGVILGAWYGLSKVPRE